MKKFIVCLFLIVGVTFIFRNTSDRTMVCSIDWYDHNFDYPYAATMMAAELKPGTEFRNSEPYSGKIWEIHWYSVPRTYDENDFERDEFVEITDGTTIVISEPESEAVQLPGI